MSIRRFNDLKLCRNAKSNGFKTIFRKLADRALAIEKFTNPMLVEQIGQGLSDTFLLLFFRWTSPRLVERYSDLCRGTIELAKLSFFCVANVRSLVFTPSLLYQIGTKNVVQREGGDNWMTTKQLLLTIGLKNSTNKGSTTISKKKEFLARAKIITNVI